MTSPEPQTDFVNEISQTADESPPQKRRWVRLLLALILIFGGSTAIIWRLLSPTHQAQSISSQPPGTRVKIAPVQIGTVEDSTDFIASLESRRSINLQPTIPGQVTQIFVKPGDTVATGTPIIQIDPRVQQTSLLGSNAAAQMIAVQLDNARTTLQALETERLSNINELQLNQQEYEKYANLADQGAVSRQTKDLYASKLSTARANLVTINSRIAAQRASIIQAERTLSQADAVARQPQAQQSYKIATPLAGTVGNIPVKVGDFVNISSPLVTISQNKPLEVNVSVPLERVALLRKGMPVELMNAQGQLLGTSRVFFIAENPNVDRRSLLIKALFNNSQGLLRTDQLVRARVIWNQRAGVLIPTTAVARIAGDTFVYVAAKQTTPQGRAQLIAQQRRVRVGEIKRNNYQVLEGLQPKDEIVVSGLLNLKDGVPIVPDSL
ncbi:efflux RND transporter periplasmic adaptor subunit [Nostoc sp. FACHB-110]|uniref:efflux RND transporter periplasmic adaptor subunit n=1 Tax=Nostoc sp. FACHB-110 TaxID=2692834 RepID=UPI0016889D7A|nr:efflux RND transporter periplasmic adaptor subunit [Nostoc sp. FACHB-110]MBD2436008.1 efflux RND transporter periplasmic adaptor subunit [Nostoc sp. FACHB-110]